MTRTAPIDRERLSRLIGDEAEEMLLCGLFLDMATKNIAVMEQALKNGDGPSCREVAHSMRGAALNLGMAEIVSLFERIETSDAAFPAQAEEALGRLRSALDRARRYLAS